MSKKFRKATTYSGQKLKGTFTVSYKIDGVRMLYQDGEYTTRSGKLPRGFENAVPMDCKSLIRYYGDCEVYKKDFLTTNSMLSNGNDNGTFDVDDIYPLGEINRMHPLFIDEVTDPQPDYIWQLMREANAQGYEGLVIRGATHWYRVKPTSTADVFVTGFFEQNDINGNPKGVLGGFETNYGKVTAFTAKDRKALWDNPAQYIGQLIEVSYKELYPTGNFRFAVKFIHFRDDKVTESFDTIGTIK